MSTIVGNTPNNSIRACARRTPNRSQKSHPVLISTNSFRASVSRTSSTTYRIDNLLSLRCKSQKLASCSSCILSPFQSDGGRIPQQLERCGTLRRSYTPRLSGHISSNRSCSGESLSWAGVQSYPESADGFQFRLQGINQRQKVSSSSGIRRIFVFGDRVSNSGQITLRSVQTRPQAKHREFTSRNLLRFSLSALACRQVEGNKSSNERASSPKPTSDCRDGSPIRATTLLKGETRNNQICQVHSASLLTIKADLAICICQRWKSE